MKTATDPRAEERSARDKLRRIEKARKAKQAKANSERWRKVAERKRASGCRCELRPGMSYRELVDLGSGCTAPRHYVCSVLDLYRQLARGAR